MPTLRSFGVPAVAGLLFLSPGVVAQGDQVTLDQIHPRTMITLGIGFGDQTLETNTGDFPPGGVGVFSRSTDAYHIRLRGEHFFESDFGIFANVYSGIADDINDDLNLGGTSSYDSMGLFIAVAYRATMDESFRLPVRFGPFIQASEEDDTVLNTNGPIERSMFGVRLSAEPEVILMQQKAGGRVSELSAFAEISCGAGPSKVEDNAFSEDGYSFTVSWEIGVRYRLAGGILMGLSYFSQKYHVGTTESYDQAVFFGVDDDFNGIMITAGARF